jgi:poly(hydroxyalkanoate) depolymerase family esterase
VSLADNIEFLRRLPKLNELKGLSGLPQVFGRAAKSSRLTETVGFGTNPGDLRMFSYLPGDQRARQRLPLVVVLHGCTQNAAGYDTGAGWSALATRYGFALLMPEQKPSNNANTCFNWFNPEDISRGSGEALSIRQMIARMARDHSIDGKRIFITGLFAGGAIIAGLPYGIASNVQQALNGMFQPPSRPARELGDLVRRASNHKGPWPKLSVWHGSADKTVNPANACEIVKQWVDVHGLQPLPMSQSMVHGHRRALWWNADGESLIESWTITDMAHGTPLGIADNDERYGAQGAFMIEAGISSSYHIASFFGLTDRVHQPSEAAKPVTATTTITVPPVVFPPPPAQPAPEINAIPWPIAVSPGHANPRQRPRRSAIDVGAVITRALTAAGLMK